jgi:hypothetical protein
MSLNEEDHEQNYEIRTPKTEGNEGLDEGINNSLNLTTRFLITMYNDFK